MNDDLPEMDFKEKKEKKRGLLAWFRSRLGIGSRGAAGAGRFGASAGLGGFLSRNIGVMTAALMMAVAGAVYLAQNDSLPGVSPGAFGRMQDNYVPAILRRQAANQGSSLDMLKDANKGAVDANDAGGYDKDGYDKDGYDKDGYDKDGYHKDGYDRDGYNKDGYDKDGYNRDGYNKDGYDKDGVKGPGPGNMGGAMGPRLKAASGSLGGSSSMGSSGAKTDSGIGSDFQSMSKDQRSSALLAMNPGARGVPTGNRKIGVGKTVKFSRGIPTGGKGGKNIGVGPTGQISPGVFPGNTGGREKVAPGETGGAPVGPPGGVVTPGVPVVPPGGGTPPGGIGPGGGTLPCTGPNCQPGVGNTNPTPCTGPNCPPTPGVGSTNPCKARMVTLAGKSKGGKVAIGKGAKAQLLGMSAIQETYTGEDAAKSRYTQGAAFGEGGKGGKDASSKADDCAPVPTDDTGDDTTDDDYADDDYYGDDDGTIPPYVPPAVADTETPWEGMVQRALTAIMLSAALALAASVLIKIVIPPWVHILGMAMAVAAAGLASYAIYLGFQIVAAGQGVIGAFYMMGGALALAGALAAIPAIPIPIAPALLIAAGLAMAFTGSMLEQKMGETSGNAEALTPENEREYQGLLNSQRVSEAKAKAAEAAAAAARAETRAVVAEAAARAARGTPAERAAAVAAATLARARATQAAQAAADAAKAAAAVSRAATAADAAAKARAEAKAAADAAAKAACKRQGRKDC